MNNNTWFPVEKLGQRCPICDHEDWCSVTKDLSYVRCERTDQDQCNTYRKIKKAPKGGTFYTNLPKQQKRERKSQTRNWVYNDTNGNPIIKVGRRDYVKNGMPRKDMWQHHWNGSEWVKGLRDGDREKATLYNYSKVKNAIGKHLIVVVEGEAAADKLAEYDITATTNIGGSNYLLPSAWEVLKNAQVVLCPDRDEPGVKFMQQLAELLPNHKWLYPYPDSSWWNCLPTEQGLDIFDWIEDMELEGKSKADIRHAISSSLMDEPKEVDFRSEGEKEGDIAEEMGLLAIFDELIEEGASDSFVTRKIIKLSEEGHGHVAALRKIYEAREKEINFTWDLQEEENNLARLLKFKEDVDKFDLANYLPAPLAKALKAKAEGSRIAPSRFMQNLFPVIGTIVGAKTSIVAQRNAGGKNRWLEYPIFYTLDVAYSGTGKTPLRRSFMAWLKSKQAEEFRKYKKYEDYQQARKSCNLGRKKWDKLNPEQRADFFLEMGIDNPWDFDQELFDSKMIQRKFLFNDFTPESLFSKLAQQPAKRGSLIESDEVPALFSGLDQYHNGKGNGRQKILEAWSNPLDFIVDRQGEGKSYQLDDQTLNIIGGVQPDVGAKIFHGGCDHDGMIARFLITVTSFLKGQADFIETVIDVSGELDHLYEQVSKFPEIDCSFEHQAYKKWGSQYTKLYQGYMDYINTNPGYAYYLAKQRAYVPRIALALHIVECAYNQDKDKGLVTLETLNKAISLSMFYCGQFRLLQSRGSEGNQRIDGIALKIWELCKERGKISTREISQKFRRKKYLGKPIKSKEALDIITLLSKQGYGKLKGKTLYISLPADPDPDPPKRDKRDKVVTLWQHSQSRTGKDFNVIGDTVTVSDVEKKHQPKLLQVLPEPDPTPVVESKILDEDPLGDTPYFSIDEPEEGIVIFDDNFPLEPPATQNTSNSQSPISAKILACDKLSTNDTKKQKCDKPANLGNEWQPYDHNRINQIECVYYQGEIYQAGKPFGSEKFPQVVLRKSGENSRRSKLKPYIKQCDWFLYKEENPQPKTKPVTEENPLADETWTDEYKGVIGLESVVFNGEIFNVVFDRSLDENSPTFLAKPLGRAEEIEINHKDCEMFEYPRRNFSEDS